MLQRWRILSVSAAVCMALVFGYSGSAATTSPLVGNQAVESAHDSDAAGQAEAFQATAAVSGTATHLVVYVDSTPPPTLSAGIYADVAGHPGALLAQGTLGSPTALAWNDVTLGTPVSLVAATKYWIAGAVTDRHRSIPLPRSQVVGLLRDELWKALSTLPATWTTGTRYADGLLSAYVPPPAADATAPTQPQGFAVTTSTATTLATTLGAVDGQRRRHRLHALSERARGRVDAVHVVLVLGPRLRDDVLPRHRGRRRIR